MKRIYAEGDLVMLLTKQDLRAYSYLYDHYSKALYGVIFKLVKKEEVAQDLLQDVFVKIWKNAGQYDTSKGRFFTWMLNIARNTGRDYLRTQQHEMVELSTVDYLMDAPDNVFRGFDCHDVKELICRLKEDYKVVIEMVYWQGYTHEETALRLKLPLGTVKTRVRKALNKLRGSVEKSLQQPIPLLS
ncbi:RNA polymerase sigma factor [Runella sp.]|uniref:RNA polymerase sigma factor n=1 Tax=Runella sp. TaxID=1960881 RepID=UPI003D0CD79A